MIPSTRHHIIVIITSLSFLCASGKLSQLVHHHEGQGHKSHSQGRGHRHISEHELKDKSDRHLNIQVCITEVMESKNGDDDNKDKQKFISV